MHAEQGMIDAEHFLIPKNQRICLAGNHRLMVDVGNDVIFRAQDNLVSFGKIEINSASCYGEDLLQFFLGKQVIEFSGIQEQVAVDCSDHWILNSKQLHTYRHDPS